MLPMADQVLIVAKCIVNINIYNEGIEDYEVLIVAKCIVNRRNVLSSRNCFKSINSSKVYCKCI